ncbi:MAG: membrane protein insertion efficiency factor YidD [Candidatus Hydrogenedentes bacterium]|nr:membrane protein insertion efficiency factor YidD [Candidatus Hydrogenedentota bacterium]
MAKLAIGLIRLYQWAISPFLGENCRFYPSCSSYAIEAFQRYGFVKGFMLSFWRLLRCQPLCKGGYDPVPEDFFLFGRRRPSSEYHLK